MSTHLLSKVEPHAKALEDVADGLDHDGIGGHAQRGHAAVLRHMASCLRADASRGRTPYIYDSTDHLYAAAEPAARSTDRHTYNLRRMSANHSSQTDVVAENALRTARRYGLNIHNGEIDVGELNSVLNSRNVSTIDRMAIKGLFAAAGLID